jgi:hypothetical protein
MRRFSSASEEGSMKGRVDEAMKVSGSVIAF